VAAENKYHSQWQEEIAQQNLRYQRLNSSLLGYTYCSFGTTLSLIVADHRMWDNCGGGSMGGCRIVRVVAVVLLR